MSISGGSGDVYLRGRRLHLGLEGWVLLPLSAAAMRMSLPDARAVAEAAQEWVGWKMRSEIVVHGAWIW